MSTQILTELPNIQKTGMDFKSVLDEIHKIVQDNPNWKENWAAFYSSEAGALLTELMAWIADNLSTRQDLLYNEMFIGTAQKDSDKIKHLKHIGYIPQMPHAATVPIVIQFEKILQSNIYLTPPRGEQLLLRPNDIAKVKSKDINGREITWEIIKMKDGKPSYLDSLLLANGNTEYKEDSEGNKLYALQGVTRAEEFIADSNDGSYFNLSEKNIASDSIQVYIKKSAAKLLEVNSFVSKDALDKSLPTPYVLELNEDKSYRIRFGSRDVLHESRLLPAGTAITVFYRVCDGALGNINPKFMMYTTKFRDDYKQTYNATVKNDLPGFGGTNQETLDKAVLNGPLSLRTMDRAVTPEDYNIILDRNTSIFKAKTYTATNQPDGFRSYYGRYINPQETFSFVMLNKNYKGVPTSKYNYFPWLTSNLEPRLNEKYVFDNGNYNLPVSTSETMFNVKVMENGGGFRSFKNATILDLGEKWNDSLFNNSGTPNTYLKGKITTSETEETFFEKIPFDLFSSKRKDYIGLKNYFGEDNFYLAMDDNARFISKQSFDPAVPVDVLKTRYLNVIINGIMDTTIDLWGMEQFDEYNMPNHAYLKWSNTTDVDPRQFRDDPSKEISKYRNGIVELINNHLSNVTSAGGKFADLKDISRQYYGIDYINSQDEPVLKDLVNSRFIDVSVQIKGITYIFRLTEEYANTHFKGSVWGSLKNLSLYITSVFSKGQSGDDSSSSIKKIVGGVEKELDDPQELNAYVCEAQERKIFDSDYDYDEDENDFSSARMLYDLVIYNKAVEKENVLTTIEFRDNDGMFLHRLENVVDVCDPDLDYKSEDGRVFKGLGYYVRGVSCTRKSKHYPHPTQAADYSSLASLKMTSDGLCRLKMQSPTIGESSNICFYKMPGLDDFGQEILGIVYNSDGYSNKAYGVKKAYLMRDDALSVTISENGNYYEAGIPIRRGNIIFENSCINNSGDFENLYCSFKAKENNTLVLGSKYDNFYYTGTITDDELKEPVSGIVGQHMDFDVLENGVKRYYLNEDKSNFDIRFTSEPQDTNSLFAIEQDLDIVKSDKVRIITSDIMSMDLGPGIAPPNLIIQYDEEPKLTVPTYDCNNGNDLVSSIKNSIQVGGSEKLKHNIDAVVKQSYENSNKVEITGIKHNNGSIKFIFDKYKGNEESNKALYKKIFGTNLTNTKFYNLYPKNYIHEDNIVNISDDEYYYCPSLDRDLIFFYRELVEDEEHNIISRAADYYINVEKIPIGDQFRYSFSIVKTKDSLFPDKEFYVHFINDKSFNFDGNGKLKETDESILQNYMYKYKISGTDITFTQPFFDTYDIAATIKYNANFSETEIVQSVRKAIDEVCDLKYAEIAGSMSRAKIFKAIMNCDGVEDCKITYFGEDYSSRSGNVETLKADFYEILCLHEDEDQKRGKILTFEVNN